MVSQGDSMAEDMGLEEVKKAQALKFQGGNTSSTLVPGIVPILFSSPYEQSQITLFLMDLNYFF
jgi:hypothetical protein